MKKIIYLFMMIVLLNMILVNAEMNLWNDVSIDHTNNIVNYQGFYQFDDTSASQVGYSKPIDLYIKYHVLALPYSLAYGYVNYCNLTITQYQNRINSSISNLFVPIIIQGTRSDNRFFNNTPLTDGYFKYQMYSKDSLQVNMKCHYNDSRSLYQENVLVGSFLTFTDAFECDECSQYSLQELSKENEVGDNYTSKQFSVYSTAETLIDTNYKFWVYFNWFSKIMIFITAIGMIFIGLFFLIKKLNELKNIK